jgi:Protein of unknown function (DUF3224)
MVIKGNFDVKMTPASEDTADGVPLGRFLLAKQYHGDLTAASKGEMLTAGSIATGSAGYVAIERVTGSVQGRKGSFALQHTGTMNRGAPTLSIHVVPHSGTDQLTGLAGSMNIIIADGKHSYEFDYSIAEGE